MVGSSVTFASAKTTDGPSEDLNTFGASPDRAQSARLYRSSSGYFHEYDEYDDDDDDDKGVGRSIVGGLPVRIR
ncbi:hypothetical protein RJ55_05776 [Drechmeria coniospora]|nr:hypothetical protein RJ55_05776 [Drechmeria coniospora]